MNLFAPFEWFCLFFFKYIIKHLKKKKKSPKIVYLDCLREWRSKQIPLPPLPFLRLALIPRGFPLRGNHSLIQTPSGSRAVEKMMGGHLLSEKKKNIFTVSEVWRRWVKNKKNWGQQLPF